MLLNCGVGGDSWEPLRQQGIPPVHTKRYQSWIFTGRTAAEAETPVVWPMTDAKNWLIWKDPDAGKDCWWEEKVTTEDEMPGWRHWLSGHESEEALGVGDGQGGLVCCSSWGRKQLEMTERLNCNELKPDYLPQSPSPNTITLAVRASTYKFLRGPSSAHRQPITFRLQGKRSQWLLAVAGLEHQRSGR